MTASVNLNDRYPAKIFVIGATGYIGRVLLKDAKQICVSFGSSSSTNNGFIQVNLNSPSDFDYAVVGPDDVVLITAAISSPDFCARETEKAWSVNVKGTSEFISGVVKQGARVIFFSSDTVYGLRDDVFDESADCYPAGEYAEMKNEVEKRFSKNKSFKSVRLSYVFSREDKFTNYLMKCAVQGEEAELFHPFVRAIIHRDDVIEGALALAKRWEEFPEQNFNFGGSEILSRIDFAECLRTVYLHKLRYTIREPDEEFFKHRPSIIAMKSPLLERLLKRPPRSLLEAARIEFT